MFWLLLLVPVIWSLVAKQIFSKTITWLEMGLNMGIAVLLVWGLWSAGTYSKMYDVEIWNGHVKGKERVWASCEHSYSCNCREVCTGSGKDRTCSQQCDTCYEHLNDWNWEVYTSAGDFKVSRIDRRGSREPPRWTAFRLGEPASIEHAFDNYIKAVPDSLFHIGGGNVEAYKDLLPEYPRVYDYTKVSHVISMGVKVPDQDLWNNDLNQKLIELGPKWQANVIILFVNTNDQMYVEALREHWLGGKKNDIVVVLGTPEFPKISWTSVMSWTDKELFKVELRDALLTVGTADRTKVIDTIDQNVRKSFVRKPMKDFEYLKNEIDPPLWALILAVLVSFIGSPALTYVFHRVDFGRR